VLIKFNLDGCGRGHEGLVHHKGKITKGIGVIGFFLLIQSKCQARPASASRHVHPNGHDVLIFKLSLKLLLGGLGQFKHSFPPVQKS